MTNLPEAKLAREAEIAFATMAMITDYDSWKIEEEPVSAEIVLSHLLANAETARRVIADVIPRIPNEPNWPEHFALDSGAGDRPEVLAASDGGKAETDFRAFRRGIESPSVFVWLASMVGRVTPCAPMFLIAIGAQGLLRLDHRPIELRGDAIENHKMKTRCFDHIDLRVTNMEAARNFYGKFLPQLGFVHESPGDDYYTVLCRRWRQAVGIFWFERGQESPTESHANRVLGRYAGRSRSDCKARSRRRRKKP